jgi:flagellar biosynthesis component FlhA
MNFLILIAIIVIIAMLIYPQIKEYLKKRCIQEVPHSIKNIIKKLVNQKIGKDMSQIIDLYSQGLEDCLSVKDFPLLKEIVNSSSSNDPKIIPCIRSALNLLIMKYWVEELNANTEENFITTMECMNKLPLNENTITRFTLRTAECAGERSPWIPDFFGANNNYQLGKF